MKAEATAASTEAAETDWAAEGLAVAATDSEVVAMDLVAEVLVEERSGLVANLEEADSTEISCLGLACTC